MKALKCETCGEEGITGFKGIFVEGEVRYYCSKHVGDIKRMLGTDGEFITDANGKRKDREWLKHKLDMTSSEKKWIEDIKSRRIMRDGSIKRFKR